MASITTSSGLSEYQRDSVQYTSWGDSRRPRHPTDPAARRTRREEATDVVLHLYGRGDGAPAGDSRYARHALLTCCRRRRRGGGGV